MQGAIRGVSTRVQSVEEALTARGDRSVDLITASQGTTRFVKL